MNAKPILQQWFKVRFLKFGYSSRGIFYPARWVEWSVLASSENEALRLAKARNRRAEQFSIMEK